MDKCQNECRGTRRRATSRPTPYTAEFLDKFDKGWNAVDLDHGRVVLNDQFCAVFKKDKHDNTCGCGGSSPNPIRRSSSACPTKHQYRRRIFGPFDPNAGFRQLAYQPTEAEKNLDRKISSNTLHGVESVNDLRSWGFNKDERRQHYLEQMILSSGNGGSAHQPETTTPLLSYKETAAPIPVLRLQEQKENAEQGKTPAKAITEQYHQEMEKQSAAAPPPQPPPPPPKEISTGTKEVQTPKLSITNLLEELTDDEKNRLFNLMKTLRGEEDDAAKPGHGDHDEELDKLRQQIKELEDRHKDALQKIGEAEHAEQPRKTSQENGKAGTDDESRKGSQDGGNAGSDDESRKGSQDGGNAGSDEESRKSSQDGGKAGSDEESRKSSQDKGKDGSDEESRKGSQDKGKDGSDEESRKGSQDKGKDGPDDQSRKGSQDKGKDGPDDQSRNATQESDGDHLQTSNKNEPSGIHPEGRSSGGHGQQQSTSPCDCEIKLLKCHNATLAHHTFELQQEIMQLREQIQNMGTNEQELHKMLQQFECAVLERNGLLELNRSLEQEVMQLRMSPTHQY